MAVFIESLKKLSGVRKAYVFGSFASHRDIPSFRVRDIDLAIEVPFHSGDLESIDRSALGLKQSAIEEEGFDPEAISFSRSLSKLTSLPMDYWVISSDKKFLHWGPIHTEVEESEEISKEADSYASRESGVTRNKLSKSSDDTRTNWYKSFSSYIENQFSDMPTGWYVSERSDIKEFIKNCWRII